MGCCTLNLEQVAQKRFSVVSYFLSVFLFCNALLLAWSQAEILWPYIMPHLSRERHNAWTYTSLR